MDDTGALGWETDSFGYPLAQQPHPDAYFDPMWRSRHGPKPMDGWRFAVRCKAGCPDAISSMPATRTPESVSEWTCPDCDGPCEISEDRGMSRLDRLTDRLVEDIMDLSDEDILAEAEADYQQKAWEVVDKFQKTTELFDLHTLGIAKDLAELIADALQDEVCEADRRAGVAERRLQQRIIANAKREAWLRQAKRDAGYDENVSFDVVWAAALKALRLGTDAT